MVVGRHFFHLLFNACAPHTHYSLCLRSPPAPSFLSVISISSLDRETGCFAFWEDCFNVADIVTEWREEWG